MKRQNYANLLFILLIATSACRKTVGEFPEVSGLVQVDNYENGLLYRTSSGKFYVLQLNGPYILMGKQYGYLMSGMMSDYYNEVIRIMTSSGLSMQEIITNSEKFYFTMPQPYRDLIDGMAETSGLGKQKQQIIASSTIMMDEKFPDGSGLMVFKSYTKNRKMGCGRNWNTTAGRFETLGKYLVVVIYRPSPYVNSVAELSYLGSTSPQTMLNEKGMYTDIHSCTISDTTVVPGRLPEDYQLFSFLLNCSTLTNLAQYFQSAKPPVSLIVNAASDSEAICFQWPTYSIQQRVHDSAGLFVSTNHYTDCPPDWYLLPVPDNPENAGYTVERRENLLTLCYQNKGRIDANKMMEILDVALPVGGATFPDINRRFGTYYQVVTLPGQLQWYVKVPGYSGWEQIAMGSILQ